MEFHYTHNSTQYTVRLEPQPDGSHTAFINGRQVPLTIQRSSEGQLNLLVSGDRVHAYTAATRTPQTRTERRYVALVDRETCFFELEKVTGHITRGSGAAVASGRIVAQMPGQVVQIAAAEGNTVEEGDLILLLEAMKMEIRVTTPLAGRIERLAVAEGDQVERGQFMAEVMPMDEGAS